MGDDLNLEEKEKPQGDKTPVLPDAADESGKAADESDSEEEEIGVPEWMKADEADEQAPAPAKGSVEQQLYAVTGKLSSAKKKLNETTAESDRLRAENEALRAGAIAPPQSAATTDVPDPDDFHDGLDYKAAMAKYIDSQVSAGINGHTAANTAQREEQKANERLQADLAAHETRKTALFTKHKISPEKYESADMAVRAAIDEVVPGGGDGITNALISKTGEGSEKVFFAVGVSAEKKAMLSNLLREDKSGIRAAMYLGELKAQLTNIKIPRSNAPPPATVHGGDGTKGANAGGQKREYADIIKNNGYTQQAFDLKDRAKAAGADTSAW